ncbi:hypothetical protein [Cohnella sp. GbtcB17]|uniref:hypothetical protein n=1 Tax=Cohnella sp. GbtcB17 TaxID=2824762 RepID=UPI001C2FF0C2|nr:hypothetical protein [Cohnella sp. GbtcB17]
MSTNDEQLDQEVLEAHTEELGEEASAEDTEAVASADDSEEAEVEAAPAVEDAVLTDDWAVQADAPAASIEIEEATESDAEDAAEAVAEDDAEAVAEDETAEEEDALAD